VLLLGILLQNKRDYEQSEKYCKKPLIVKLTPNVTDIKEIAVAAEAAGADALPL